MLDNTLGAVSHSVKEIVKEEADDYFVVVLSDANITQYNIHPNDIARGKVILLFVLELILTRFFIGISVLKADDRVTAQMIFIGSLQDQAEK